MDLMHEYHRSVPNSASLTTPLTDLTKKGYPNKALWAEPCPRALEGVQTALTSDPILRSPDLSKPFVFMTNASDKRFGAALLQEFGTWVYTIAHAIRRLPEREQNCAEIANEFLAIVRAIKAMERSPCGNHSILESGHLALSSVLGNVLEIGRVMRWSLSL